MRFLSFCLLLSTTLAFSQTPDPTPIDARVFGTVVDANSKPVSGAIVYATEEATMLADAYRLQTTTNRAGRFDFGAKLRHGVYQLYARKDKDGYPDPNSTFYRDQDFNPTSAPQRLKAAFSPRLNWHECNSCLSRLNFFLDFRLELWINRE